MEWPELVIQKVQSSLSDRDAVRSCSLSKGWLRSHSTHPVLRIAQSWFRGKEHKFLMAVGDGLARYRQHNLRIERLELSIEQVIFPFLINNWIDGAIRYSRLQNLSISFSKFNVFELDLKILNAKTLFQLRVGSCRLEPDSIFDSSCLVMLDLNQVEITESLLDRLLSNCPLLENLILYECRGFNKMKIDGCNLKRLNEFTFTPTDQAEVELFEICSIPVKKMAWRIPSIFRFAGGTLTSLELSSPMLTDVLLADLLRSLPVLTRLDLSYCELLKQIDVGDVSLDSFNVSFCSRLRGLVVVSSRLESLEVSFCNQLVEMGVSSPRLKCLTYRGCIRMRWPKYWVANNDPTKVFTTIDVRCPRFLGQQWFLALREALVGLGRCDRLSIIVKPDSLAYIGFNTRTANGPLPIVENVCLYMRQESGSTKTAITDAIRFICQPVKVSIR